MTNMTDIAKTTLSTISTHGDIELPYGLPPPYADNELRAICDDLHDKLAKANLTASSLFASLTNSPVVDDMLACMDRTNDGSEAAHAQEAYTTDSQHQEVCLSLDFDEMLTPNQFSDIPARTALHQHGPAMQVALSVANFEWCPRDLSSDPDITQLINTVHEAVPSLQQILVNTDNAAAASIASEQLVTLLKLAKELDLASKWTGGCAQIVCDELRDTEASIAANITNRQEALHSNSLEAVEALDQSIGAEVAELRSSVHAQLEQVVASFALLAGAEANADTLCTEVNRFENLCFQLPWDAVSAEIEECKGPRAASLDEYRDQIAAHRDQLKGRKARHLSSLQGQQASLLADQQSITLALRTLANQYEANSVQQNVVGTKIDETKQSIEQVGQAWADAVVSIAPPAERLANRLSDLEAHRNFMTHMQQLHSDVLQQAASITSARDCFLKEARTRIVHNQFDALTVAYSHQYKSVAKANKGTTKRRANLHKLEEQRNDAELEDDVQEMLQLTEKIRELSSKFQEATAKSEQREAELEQTDESLQSVIKTAITATEREELLTGPTVFYSIEQRPLQFELAGKAIVHPRVSLRIEELEQATITADRSTNKQKEELKRQEAENQQNKQELDKAKALAITATPSHLTANQPPPQALCTATPLPEEACVTLRCTQPTTADSVSD